MSKCKRCHKEDGECIAGYEHVFEEQGVTDRNIKKALKVLASGTTNPIIIADMARVLQREFSHMETTMDMQSKHVGELLQDKASLRDAALEAVEKKIFKYPNCQESRTRNDVMHEAIEAIKKAFDEPT